MDSFNYLAGLASIISLTIAIFQWKWNKKLKDERFVDLEALYSSLYGVVCRCQKIRTNMSPTAAILGEVQNVEGEINAIRRKIISISKNQYKRQPNYIPPYAHAGNFQFPPEPEQQVETPI